MFLYITKQTRYLNILIIYILLCFDLNNKKIKKNTEKRIIYDYKSAKDIQ
jgi:hypothetical protein